MTKLIARIKILPSEADTNLDQIINNLKLNPPKEMEFKTFVKEPIAFGLFSIICDFTLNDAEGQMDTLEDYIKSTEGVGEIQVINISRHSVNVT